MVYQDLRKLYYGDPAIYSAEYARRFSSPDAVKLDFMIGNRQAFFVETREILHLVIRISRLDKEVCLLSAKLPDIAKQQYSRKCMIGEITITNQIEGVHSGRKEIGEVLAELAMQSDRKRKYPGFSTAALPLCGKKRPSAAKMYIFSPFPPRKVEKVTEGTQ